MDLTQKKLSKAEWEAIEVPLPAMEKNILQLVRMGYNNVNIKQNNALSLLVFMKITKDFQLYHAYFYTLYFKKLIDTLTKKYKFPCLPKDKKTLKVKLKTADKIRIENSSTKLETIKGKIYEFILLDIVKKLGKKRKPLYYYTLHQLMKNSIDHLNTYVITFIKSVLAHLEENIASNHIIKNATKYMERNDTLSKWADMRLYTHQKQLFTHCKDPDPKLILYQAPTGTGKTISPIGLAECHKLIFVCAAKHVGLQLAKCCISMNLPIAIAFGCGDASDIRLHYFAVKDYVKNRRTGGIFRVDNSVGDKVQIIVADVQSYLPAMHYMLAFNQAKDIIWYWDEPTITLDYKEHKYHELLKRNWTENKIPNVVLSSATLPSADSIRPCIQSHKVKFMNASLYSISSYECKKTIPIVDSEGCYILPHLYYNNYTDIMACTKHLQAYKTILRHFNLSDIVKFLLYVNKKKLVKTRFMMEYYFENPLDINVLALKEYYLVLLLQVEEHYADIYTYFQKEKKKALESSIYITTKDAYTLTDGPSIFIANDVEKIGKFCLKTANIPASELDNILKSLKVNDKLQKQIRTLQQQDEAKIEGKEKKKKEENKELEGLYAQIKTIQLDKQYVPNSFLHLNKWGHETAKSRAFTSDICEEDVERIVALPIQDIWKILLLMGIGVFKDHDCVMYGEIMKKLAATQRLYLIIASSDYIYGTNYQFCHGYLGKDLGGITQEKIIQAFGRVGRSNAIQDYSIRLRDDTMIDKLLKPAVYKPEVENMNRLFGI